jgi:hypothetical protein
MAKKVPVGRGNFAIVDDEDFDLMSRYVWQAAASGSGSGLVYAVTKLRMHRLVVNAPPGFMVDHINGDSLDNRKSNLRICTNAENQQNTPGRGGSSRYKGVSFNTKRQKWYGTFLYNGEYFYCGAFDNEEDCARAVDKKRREVCGNFASLNLWHLSDEENPTD